MDPMELCGYADQLAEFYNITGQLAANRLYFVLSGGLQTATIFIDNFVYTLGSC